MSNSRNRVLLTANISLTDTDGKSFRVLNLAELFSLSGYAVTLIVSRCRSIRAAKFSVIETGAHPMNMSTDSLRGKAFHSAQQLVSLLAFYMKLMVNGASYRIVVSTLVGPEIDSLCACLFSRIKRASFVYDYDDPSPEIRLLLYGGGEHDPRFRLSLFTRDILIRNAKLVLTSADTTRHQILKDSSTPKKVCVLYNLPPEASVPIDQDKTRLRQRLGLNQDSFIVSYLGNIPIWGVRLFKDTLINCARNFRSDEKVLFLLIGGGLWEKQYVRLVKKLSLSHRVLVTGRLSRQKALEYLAASDVSFWPFGINRVSTYIVPTKLFESMVLGVPVLCPPLPNFTRILGSDGIYFDGSDNDLVEKIRGCERNKKELKRISSDLISRFLVNFASKKGHFDLMKTIGEVLD